METRGGRLLTDYRGIDKHELMRSIAEGIAWLKKCDLGPVSNDALREFRIVDLLEALDRADSRVAVAGVMKDYGVCKFLHRFHDAFSYDPEVYPGDAVSSPEAASLLKRLTALGAFSPADPDDNPHELDEEMRRFRIRRAAAHLSERHFSVDSPDFSVLELLVAERREEDKVAAEWIERTVPLLVALYEINDETEAGRIMAENVHDLPALLDTMHTIMGVVAPTGISTANQPIMSYGVAMKGNATDMDRMEWEDIERVLGPLKQRLRAVLEKFYDTDEATRISTGTLGAMNKFGVFFHATRRAAQAVADALSDVEVIDFAGQRIWPAAPRQGLINRPMPGI